MSEWLEPALRFLHYAALLGLFGWTAFPLIGLRVFDFPRQTPGRDMLTGAAMAAPLLSLALMLTSIAVMMAVPISALDWQAIEAMVLTTDFGWAFLVRVGLLVVGLCAVLARRLSTAAPLLASACFAGALMTLGWSGHAAATEGALGLFHRLNNGLHLLAAGLWLGAIGWFLHLTRLARREPAMVPTQPLLDVMHRFAPLGIALVATVSITGLINAQLIFGLENSPTVIAAGYGVLLAAKAVLVAVMIGFGAHNARIGQRSAMAETSQLVDGAAALAALRNSIAKELAIGVVIVGLVALLGTLSPMMA